MPKAIAANGYASLTEAVQGMLDAGLHRPDIASLLGIDTKRVAMIESRLRVRRGERGGGRQVLIPTDALAALEPHAARRGMSVNELVRVIVEAVVDCHAIIARAGIQLPMMYRLGFPNANCRGCVNAQSPRYWNRTRRHFPDVFQRRAALSRKLGVRLVKLGSGKRERIFLDELDPNIGDGDEEPSTECSLLCYIAEQRMG